MKNAKPSRSRVAPAESSICQFPFADGRQCRILRHKSHPTLCLFHAREEQQFLELDRIGAELQSLSGDFTTFRDLNHVVGKLFKLVAANRIPARNAALLAYLAQLLLYTQKDLKHEQTIAYGYLGWEKIIRDIYVSAGLACPNPAVIPAAALSLSAPPADPSTPAPATLASSTPGISR
ncbi:MAG TPA: hypothetical protein VGR03_02675 [Candidatus Acidoferrum sp.]|nr:hypothetical protein [Candidatus Acidoferrum sp.]